MLAPRWCYGHQLLLVTLRREEGDDYAHIRHPISVSLCASAGRFTICFFFLPRFCCGATKGKQQQGVVVCRGWQTRMVGCHHRHHHPLPKTPKRTYARLLSCYWFAFYVRVLRSVNLESLTTFVDEIIRRMFAKKAHPTRHNTRASQLEAVHVLWCDFGYEDESMQFEFRIPPISSQHQSVC